MIYVLTVCCQISSLVSWVRNNYALPKCLTYTVSHIIVLSN